MNFEMLHKSPEVAPLLVRLYDTHNLYNLAGDQAAGEARYEMANAFVDVLNVKLGDSESALITDVLFELIKQAEKDLRLALAERLATMNNVPLRIVLGLANDDVMVADPILRSSPVLHDMDLIYILQSKGVAHGRCIARREGLSGTIINMLADTHDFEIAVNLSGNDGIRLTDHAYKILGDMAKDSGTLAKPLLSRDDLPKDVAAQLYQFVGEELKKSLRNRFGIGADKISDVVDDVAAELRDQEIPLSTANDSLYNNAMILYKRGSLPLSSVIATLRRGQFATFLAQFAVYCGQPMESMKMLLRNETGKGLAVACRAMDIQKADFVSLYLLTQKFRSAQKKVVTQKDLTRIMTMFDEIKPEEARQILNSTRH